MIAGIVFSIFLVSILIFLNVLCIWYCNTCIKKIEIFTHNTIDFEHNIKVCWIKYLKNKFLFLFLFCIISPPNTIWSLIFYIIYPLVTIWGTREQSNSFNQGNLHTKIWAQLSIYMYIMCSKHILYLHVYQPQD